MTHTARDSLKRAGLTKPGIDAHAHLWSGDALPAIVREAADERPDLQAGMSCGALIDRAKRCGLNSLMLVQARDPWDGALEEAVALSALAARHPEITGVIAGFDLNVGPRAAVELAKLKNLPSIRGIRMIDPENSGCGTYSSEDAFEAACEAGRCELSIDILFRCKNPGQLDEVEMFLHALGEESEGSIVIDHLGKPLGLSDGIPGDDWISAMKRLGASHRFFLKLSALRGEAGPNADRSLFFPFYDLCLAAFGPEQLIFGSDHPVSFDYAECVLDVSEWILSRGLESGGLADMIFHDNAIAAYSLPVAKSEKQFAASRPVY